MMPPPRRQTKERHNLHLMDVKKHPVQHTPRERQQVKGKAVMKEKTLRVSETTSRGKNPRNRQPEYAIINTLYKNNYPVFNKIIPN